MDFIDEFIEEYRNNPCLWKANSVHFKNRTKRQEAYLKLIEVAARHGEHYNIERTKQKINNLRCAFRHQLRKYTEFKSKTGRDEPYCPKRRYFESLMFLMEEENQAERMKFGENLQELKTLEKKVIDIKETNESTVDASSLNAKTQVSEDEFNASCDKEDIEFQKEVETCTKAVTPPKGDQSSNVTVREISPRTNNILNRSISAKSVDTTPKQLPPPSVDFKNHTDFSPQLEIETEERKTRVRRASISSQASNESETFPTKCLKVDCTSKDFQKLLTLACSNIDRSLDDNFSHFGKIVAQKLRSLSPQQALFAEKLISDILFQGHLGLLSASNIENFSICQ